MYTLLYLTCTRTYAPDLYVYMYTLLYTLLYNRYMYTMVSTSGAGALLGAGFATKPKGGGDEASTGFRYKRYSTRSQTRTLSLSLRLRLRLRLTLT